MVFRRESRIDSFQRQISALRSQIGEVPAPEPMVAPEPLPEPTPMREMPVFGSGFAAPSEPVFRMPAMPMPTFQDQPFSQPAGAPVFHEAPLAQVPVIDELTSVVSRATTWRGELESDGNVHVHGRVNGSVTARNEVFVAEDAEVEAAITAEVVVVAGVVRGTITCTGRFEVLPSGKVLGDVFAPALVVHEGALVTGNVAMTTDGAAMRHPSRRPAWNA